MAELLERRQALHRRLACQEKLNSQLHSQLGQFQALANLGMVSAMIAHEMNNILTPLGNYAQLALNHPDDRALTEKTLQKTVLNSRRASKILESMLAMATGKEQAKGPCRLKEMVDEIFMCLARDFSKDKIEVRVEIDEKLEAFAEGVCLQQVLMNLILNAREAMLPRGGTLTISAARDSDAVSIAVSDTGCGIEPGNIEKVFEAFFTTKTSESDCRRTGAGLGLAFCRRVVDSHGGEISVESEAGKGTQFRISLPCG